MRWRHLRVGRKKEDAVRFVRAFFDAGKPVDLPAFCEAIVEEFAGAAGRAGGTRRAS